MRWRVYFQCCLAVLLLAAGVVMAQKKPLTNDDVIQMVQAGFDEATIVKAIEASEPAFDTSVTGLIALKNANVPQGVINAILTATQRAAEQKEAAAKEQAEAEARRAEAEARAKAEADARARAEAEAAAKAAAEAAEKAKNKDVPEDVGVYVKVKDQLVEVMPELVSWKSGGVGKRMLTYGMTKGHVNGVVKGKNSKLQLALPIEIIIRCPEGIAAAEYQLLDLDEKGDRREFRAVTGGVYHSSGGTDKNAVGVEPEKFAPRTYRIRIASLKKGEYGFLAPGGGQVGSMGGAASGTSVTGGATNSGKIYTFSILE